MSSSALTDKERVALKVVDLAKALILADNHFLSAAVGRLRVSHGSFSCPLATNGFELGIDAEKICAQFKDSKTVPKHDLLHTVLHCVFLHPYVSLDIDGRLWNLACDIAVEKDVDLVCGTRGGVRGEAISAALEEVAAEIKGNVTAEKIYRALAAGRWSGTVGEWEALFSSDDHAPWYMWQQPADRDTGEGAGSVAKELCDGACSGSSRAASAGVAPVDSFQGGGVDRSSSDGGPGQGDGMGFGDSVVRSVRAGAALREVDRGDRSLEKEGWRRVAKALAVSLQTYAKSRGKALAGMVAEIEETVHERVDYGDFLRQFATPGEVLKVSQDEFDYIFYTYGLEFYGNLPLIEPLEYREEKRIREFVIVIDTSGSVQGDIVRRFIDTTFGILKSTEAFFERVHIRIIQCDAQVQSDDVITSLDELGEWGRAVSIFGLGGTDFRPAFAYVDKLVEDGEFENLGGLVYFTDGWGSYPEWMPSYKVAFVFYDENYRPEIVPTWAAQIVLDESSVLNGGRQVAA